MNKYWIKTATTESVINHWADAEGFTIDSVLDDTDDEKRQILHGINRDEGGETTDEKIRAVFEKRRFEFIDGILRHLCDDSDMARPGSVSFREFHSYQPLQTGDRLPNGAGRLVMTKYGIKLWLLNTPIKCP